MSKVKIFTTFTLMFLFLSPVIYANDEEKKSDKAKEFKFFDWTISFDKEEKKKTEDQLEDEVEKFIRTTDDKQIVRERERVKREKARIQKRKEREIDRAERIREVEIKKAKLFC